MRMNTILAGIAMTLLLLALPSAASDHTLGVFGNANEDDTINMQDVTYTELIILEYRDRTVLADGKYDGKINMQDVTQIELVILGKEKEITILDGDEEAVTVNKPVKRVIPDHITSLVAMRVLDAEDVIVGTQALTYYMGPTFLQDLSELPSVGGYRTPDYEAILSLNPDVYFVYSAGQGGKETLRKKLPGVTVITTGHNEPYPPENLAMDMRKLGHILDRRDQAEEYIDWYNGYRDMIKERTAGLSEDEKPRVYVTCFSLYSCRSNFPPCDIAGGINIGAGIGARYCTTVDPEWVVEQNPDVIIDPGCGRDYGYDVDDPSALIAMREEILNRSELANVAAVKEGRVYELDIYSIGLFPNNIISIAYYTKWLHPDLFEDLDPQAIHQEYLDRFSPLNFNVDDHGVFVYPEPEES